jgi:Helix-turn-helix domain
VLHLLVPPDPDKDDYDHRLVRALDHPVRVRFLELLAERESLSPREALPLLRIPATTLSRVNYHVRVLNYFELVAPGEEDDPGRGVPFQATEKGEAALAALGIGKFD